MKLRFSRIQIFQTSLLLLSLILGYLVIFPLREAADRRAEILKNRLIGQLENSLGIDISYDSISPALLSIVTVRGLKVEFDEGDFSAKKVRVFYNPLRRLTGQEDDPIKLISRIAVNESDLNLSLSSAVENDNTTSRKIAFDPWPLLVDKSVDITGFSVNLNLNESSIISAEDISLQLKDDKGTVRYSLQGTLYASSSGGMERFGRIETSLSSRGRYSPSTATANGRLDLLKAESNIVTLQPMAVDFTFSGNELTARRLDDSVPLDLAFRFSDKEWSINGEAVGLSMREIAVPGASVGSWDPWFSSVIDGAFEFSSSKAHQTKNYDVDLNLSMQAGKLPWDAAAELKFRGSEESADIDMIKLSSGWGDFTYKGIFSISNLAPEGRIAFNLEDRLLGYPISAVFSLKTNNGAISAEPVLFDAAGLDFEDFRFLIIREPDIYALSLLVIPGMEGDETARRLTIDGLFDTSASPVFHGYASIEGFDSEYIVRILGLNKAVKLPVIKNSFVNMQGYFEANKNTWVLSVNNGELRDKDNQENYISFKGRASPGNLSVDSLRVSWNDYIVDGRGYGQSTEDGGIAEARILIDEEMYPLNAHWFSDGKLQIDSDFGLSAHLGSRSVNGRSLQVLSNDISIPLKNGFITADMDIRGRVSRNDWDLYINKTNLKLTGKPDDSELTISFNGTVNPGTIILPDIKILDNLGNLSGNAYFESSNAGKSMNGRFFLGSQNEEAYDIALFKDDKIWDIGIKMNSARLERLKKEGLKGSLTAIGRMTGTLNDPLINLDINTTEGFLDGEPLEVRGTLTMENGRVRVQDLFYQYEGMSLSRGLFLANLSNGTMRSTAELNATYNQVPVSSGFSLAMDYDRSFSLFELLEIPHTGFKGTLATRAVLWDSKEHLPAFTFQFFKNDDYFRMQTPDKSILDVEYQFGSGELNMLSGDPMPVVTRGGGVVKDGQMDLSFPEFSLDPVFINYAMFRDPILLQYHVIFQSGRFTGNLDINGPTSNPLINGEVLADKLQVDTPYTYADIKPASTKIHFKDHRVDVDTLEIPVGDGIVYAGGHIILDRLKLVEFDMTYGGKGTVRGPGVPVYYPMMGVNLDGVFTGEVRMTGGDKYFVLTGNITFPYLKASLGSAIIPVSQAREGVYPASVDFDFNFITGKNCTFFLPNEQFKIVKATAESGRVINLQYSNRPKSMSITGRLPIKSGDIYYFDRDFQITEGSIIFNESLGNFDPMLSIRAETKVRDDNGDDVSVALVYNSPVKSDFTPRIETIPSRSDLEVMALFGQAVAPYSESKDSGAASTVLLATGGMFGQVGIVQPFEDVLREGLNLDMVTIRTDIIENTLAEGLARGESTNDSTRSTGLGRYLDNTSLYAGKYIGDALFISGTVSANYFEKQRLRSVFGGLEFETSVSLEMETPFFNVAWSYSPDPTRNQNFVAENEISLKWQFSF